MQPSELYFANHVIMCDQGCGRLRHNITARVYEFATLCYSFFVRRVGQPKGQQLCEAPAVGTFSRTSPLKAAGPLHSFKRECQTKQLPTYRPPVKTHVQGFPALSLNICRSQRTPIGGIARDSEGSRSGVLVTPFPGSIGGHRASEAATCR
jgi:hypothetical protein